MTTTWTNFRSSTRKETKQNNKKNNFLKREGNITIFMEEAKILIEELKGLIGKTDETSIARMDKISLWFPTIIPQRTWH